MGDVTDAPLPSVSVDANTLARWLGLPPKAVYDLWKASVLKRSDGRLFDIEDNVRRYCEHLRGQRKSFLFQRWEAVPLKVPLSQTAQT